LKRILPQHLQDDSMVKLFMQEARLAARISHPNVVQIFDVGQIAGRHFIAMEFVRGWDLNTVLRRAQAAGEKVPVDVAVRIAADIAAGVHAAHTSHNPSGQVDPIIHRDVSPHNVLLSADGLVKVTDFGVAKARPDRHSNVTPTHSVKGKYAYLAPELLSGGAADVRTDVYALGLVLYLLLTGVQPYRGESDIDTLQRVLHHVPPGVKELRPEVSDALASAVEKATARDVRFRFASAAELHQALSAASPRLTGASEVAQWLKSLKLEPPSSQPAPSDALAMRSNPEDVTPEGATTIGLPSGAPTKR
jgi:eukaryotic-like serine/threonine-protein kinase